MMGRSIVDMVEISIAVPRGEAGYWSIIRELDRDGPWTVRQICQRTNVKTQAVGTFVRKLRLAGIAQVVEKQASNEGGRRDNLPEAVVYRLAKRPLLAPRLTLDGKVRPEMAIDRVWRAIKMSKVFSLADIKESCPDVHPSAAEAYLRALCRAGVVVGTPRSYRLARNLGLQAPKILATKVVFDPNSKTVIGCPVANEAKP
ncbi:MarR family transcriptional regulator [Mesorhizobium sp. M6A.T.Ca.TU.002.02.2.1]|uniref:MarR family transcriptional regulator n=1 Tax=Mesorhizobium sp. TaxID=1871066 RepID=UPI000FD1FA92|nr:helix-turn-helix domain-containing protein [Mesorhizobium sp.]RUU24985.1 MarR family transcriptional regulator [Mesorhizobium sp. M6A.T.Ca.TU.002.02.2.1]TIM52606.1 MAG: MarR family transcriptional regulator [Mesorhizobium sp.]